MRKLSISLDDLADKLENVQWHGEYFSAACCFHTTLSGAPLMVYRDGYRCLSCQAHGSIQSLALKLNSTNHFVVSVPQVGNSLPAWYQWLKMFGTWENLVDVAHNTVLSNSKFGTYFINRGIGDFIKSCRLGYLDGWYVFPVYEPWSLELQTIVVRAGKSKHTDSKYVLRPKQSPDDNFLYIPDPSRFDGFNYKDLHIPFGIIDAISLKSVGLNSATGTTGKVINPSLLDDFRAPIWIIPDRGEDKEATALYGRLGWRGRLLRLNYPKDCKDSNDILVKYGPDMLLALVSEAKENCTQTLHQKEH